MFWYHTNDFHYFCCVVCFLIWIERFNFFNYQPWQYALSVTMCCAMIFVSWWYLPLECNADWFSIYMQISACICFTDINIATLDFILWYDYLWTCISLPICALFIYNEAAFDTDALCLFPAIVTMSNLCPVYFYIVLFFLVAYQICAPKMPSLHVHSVCPCTVVSLSGFYASGAHSAFVRVSLHKTFFLYYLLPSFLFVFVFVK